MRLTIPCPLCEVPLEITMPAQTTEHEAEIISRLLVCEPCGTAANEPQRNHEAPQVTVAKNK